MSIYEQCEHLGIKRTLYFSKMVDPAVKIADIRMVVLWCTAYWLINPASVQWQKVNLGAIYFWKSLGIDIMHVGSQLCLTIIDCGPSCFATGHCWHNTSIGVHLLQPEPTCQNIIKQWYSVFFWAILAVPKKVEFQCANVLGGNGIVERSHQSIKVIAARKWSSIPKAVYWYNATPKDGVSPTTAPANKVHAYHLELRGIDIATATCNAQGKHRIGDEAWVKTPHSKWTDKLRMGYLTQIISLQSVRIDGMLHHVKDLWPVVGSKPSSDDERDSEDSTQLVYLKSDPLSDASDISTLPVASCSDADGSSTDESSSEDEAPVILLWWIAWQRRPAQSYTVSNRNRGRVQNEFGNLQPWMKQVRACVVVQICLAGKLCICRCSHQADMTFSQAEELCDLKIRWRVMNRLVDLTSPKQVEVGSCRNCDW